jgi:hypothetical protein
MLGIVAIFPGAVFADNGCFGGLDGVTIDKPEQGSVRAARCVLIDHAFRWPLMFLAGVVATLGLTQLFRLIFRWARRKRRPTAASDSVVAPALTAFFTVLALGLLYASWVANASPIEPGAP